MPSDSNSSGPLQHADAPKPATIANSKERFGVGEFDIIQSHIRLI